MPFRVIAGRFAPEFGSPDGDSVRFVADTPELLCGLRLRGRAPNVNRANGSVQLRFEAIDAMEKAALEPFSSLATAANLAALGADREGVEARGYICSNQAGPHGRPIAFVFAGEPPAPNGVDLFLRPGDIAESVNLRLLEQGHAYPLFYDTLFEDLREPCAAAVSRARRERLGVWAADRTSTGAEWTGSVATMAPIFPKLWRRIESYARDETRFDPEAPLAGLVDWIRTEKPERVFLRSEGRFTGFDNVIEADARSVRMSVDPLDLTILSTPPA